METIVCQWYYPGDNLTALYPLDISGLVVYNVQLIQ